MFKERFGARGGGAARERCSDPECLAIREEIMTAVFADGSAVESVSIHLEKCESCRAWEAEIRNMHRGCSQSAAPRDIRRLTASAVQGRSAEASASAGRRGPRAKAGRAKDRGVRVGVALAAALFNLLLAFRLEGGARALYPVVGFAVMMASAAWVFVDASRRKMPAAFWTALQPFTVPVGLAAYLVCRERASLRCPSCGRAVPSGDRFCPECGKGLAPCCCGCGRVVRREFRVCPYCGTRLEECFPREDQAGRTCGWSRAQIAFIAAANAALIGGFLAAIARGDVGTSLAASLIYFFGYFPVFNWVSIDSRRRAMPTILWGLLALVTLYAGLVIYLACRKDERVECPVCGSYPPMSFNFCPCCGSSLGTSCPSCGAAARTGRFCASCGTETITSAVSPRSPE